MTSFQLDINILTVFRKLGAVYANFR